MPRGFSGGPATTYLGTTSEAHSRATNSGKRITDSAPSSIMLRERQLPFTPTEGNNIAVGTGRRNSSNIVVDQYEYDAITHRISQADEHIGQCLYDIANEIEELCHTIFILPDAVPRCLNISESVQRSLGHSRSLTEDVLADMRRFARDIIDIR